MAPASTSVRRIRADHPDVPMTTASASAGVTMSAASILVLNPSPTNAPASTSHRMGRSLSSARSTAHAAATRNRIRNGSGRFSRLTEALIGLRASTSPATVAAPTPNRRRTVHPEHAHARRAGHGAREEEAPARVAEQPDRERADPQRHRRLVDRDVAARVERGEEEVVPAGGHAPHRGRVVGVAEPVAGQTPGVEPERRARRRRRGPRARPDRVAPRCSTRSNDTGSSARGGSVSSVAISDRHPAGADAGASRRTTPRRSASTVGRIRDPRVGVVHPVHGHLDDRQPRPLRDHQQLGVEEPAVVPTRGSSAWATSARTALKPHCASRNETRSDRPQQPVVARATGHRAGGRDRGRDPGARREPMATSAPPWTMRVDEARQRIETGREVGVHVGHDLRPRSRSTPLAARRRGPCARAGAPGCRGACQLPAGRRQPCRRCSRCRPPRSASPTHSAPRGRHAAPGASSRGRGPR